MPTRGFFLKTGLAAILVLGWSALTHAQMPAYPATPATPAAPTKPATPGKKPDAPEATIPGTNIARANGHWLGLTIEGGGFKLSFYDKDKLPETADVAQAALRWNTPNVVLAEHEALNPDGDNKSFSNLKFVKKPWNFKIYIALLSAKGEVVESFVVDFQGEGDAAKPAQ